MQYFLWQETDCQHGVLVPADRNTTVPAPNDRHQQPREDGWMDETIIRGTGEILRQDYKDVFGLRPSTVPAECRWDTSAAASCSEGDEEDV